MSASPAFCGRVRCRDFSPNCEVPASHCVPQNLLPHCLAKACRKYDIPIGDVPREATSTGGAFGETAEVFSPATTCFNRAASAVKFWAMRTVPPKSTMAIKRLALALASINLDAACRALIWSLRIHSRVVKKQHQILLLRFIRGCSVFFERKNF